MDVGTPASEVIARAEGVLGELVLRQRTGLAGEAVVELWSGGVHLMDTEDATTERLLAQLVLRRLPRRGRGAADGDLQVLVGGLGLGYTASALLADPRVGECVVVEIEPALTAWLRDGLVPPARGLLDDARLRVVHGDVRDVLATWPAAELDAVLLDVDNGPDFLTHPANAALYRPPALAAASTTIRPGGVLAIWSAERSGALRAAMTDAVGPTEEVPCVVHRHGRDLEYVLYLARRR